MVVKRHLIEFRVWFALTGQPQQQDDLVFGSEVREDKHALQIHDHILFKEEEITYKQESNISNKSILQSKELSSRTRPTKTILSWG